jgi:hypothetical protein
MAILFAEGFEEAFIGIGERNGIQFATYDYSKCIEILTKREKMNEQQAEDYLENQVMGARSGETDLRYLPSFLTKMTFDEYKQIDSQIGG